ncbi:MAG: hypothetical protein KY476_26775, partial [Planctomycetes bacterium]|nr:hypothetical protein [Planctomycetota bacterium]
MPRIRHRRLIPSAIVAGLAMWLVPGARSAEPISPPPAESVTLAAHTTAGDALAERVQIVERSSSSRSARERAIRSLPLDKLAA